MSVMLLTRPESVTTTVRKRAVTCRCVSHSQKRHPRLGEESRHLILAAEGPRVSSLLTRPGLPWPDENNTCNQSLLFVWSGVIKSVCWLTQYTDLNEEANVF